MVVSQTIVIQLVCILIMNTANHSSSAPFHISDKGQDPMEQHVECVLLNRNFTWIWGQKDLQNENRDKICIIVSTEWWGSGEIELQQKHEEGEFPGSAHLWRLCSKSRDRNNGAEYSVRRDN